MLTIDIDRDAAHEIAQRELAKPIYPKASLSDRIEDWFNDLLYRLLSEASSMPGGWLTITVLGILVAVALIVAVRVIRRTMRTARSGEHALLSGHDLSAAQHRRTAEQFAAAGDWAPAIRHRLRAVARQLEESAVLEPVPGRTATELARDAGRALPELADQLRSAATAFNDVTYGERPGTEAAYRLIVDLDDRLRRTHPASGAGGAVTPVSTDGWAEVR
ncbi:DUF4129 domain-containing protein [Mycolicibacterium elephantis]|uniref:DUF4129 domain-containing protein n=1 Tax=Mycolicibacterium elephantis TaxID=81858 RepID=UPI0007E9CC11|nr:DUF4129 domain-containing protein [Mycolicibacterium elephantis]OBB24593.1 hypothetical protein A5762_11815 [Mycolicibacterium elephantis]